MKKYFLMGLMLFSIGAIKAQIQVDSLIAKQKIKIHGYNVTGVSNDIDTSHKDSSKVMSEAATKTMIANISSSGSSFDPAANQTITGNWSFTNGFQAGSVVSPGAGVLINNGDFKTIIGDFTEEANATRLVVDDDNQIIDFYTPSSYFSGNISNPGAAIHDNGNAEFNGTIDATGGLNHHLHGENWLGGDVVVAAHYLTEFGMGFSANNLAGGNTASYINHNEVHFDSNTFDTNTNTNVEIRSGVFGVDGINVGKITYGDNSSSNTFALGSTTVQGVSTYSNGDSYGSSSGTQGFGLSPASLGGHVQYETVDAMYGYPPTFNETFFNLTPNEVSGSSNDGSFTSHWNVGFNGIKLNNGVNDVFSVNAAGAFELPIYGAYNDPESTIDFSYYVGGNEIYMMQDGMTKTFSVNSSGSVYSGAGNKGRYNMYDQASYQYKFLTTSSGGFDFGYYDLESEVDFTFFTLDESLVTAQRSIYIPNRDGVIATVTNDSDQRILGFKQLSPNTMTTTEINAITYPPQGLQVYNSTLHTICFYNGTNWQKVSSTNMN